MIFQNKGIRKVGLQCIAKGKRNMALDMYRGFRQATDMKDYSVQLKSVRRQLVSEKSSIARSWQGNEVTYIIRSIDRSIEQVDRLIGLLQQAERKMKLNAEQIDALTHSPEGGGSR